MSMRTISHAEVSVINAPYAMVREDVVDPTFRSSDGMALTIAVKNSIMTPKQVKLAKMCGIQTVLVEFGLKTWKCTGIIRPLQVCYEAGWFCLGTKTSTGYLFIRESEYFRTLDQAVEALAYNEWMQQK